MALSQQWLDELRQRTTLSTLVAQTVPLKRAGHEYKGRCPFHEEKTPSFHVNDAKAFYHCFGCGAHGDAIGWMIDQRGLSFIDAVKELAGAAGMEMPAPDPRAAERQERQAGLHDVTAAAARWFSARLQAAEGGAARAYLHRRGVSAEQVAEFAIGYAPGRRDALAGALDQPAERLLEAGLLGEGEDGGRYERFRDRLIIPIHDARGRVIGFGGRTLGDAQPKYLNSPDTPLFDKGRTLFNLHRAAPAARKAGRLLVVEGYMDVIALAGAGVEEAVAPLGTAVTEAQLELLWRQVDVPVLCFDGDAAGERAAMRAAERALPLLKGGRSLAFVTLPAGQDPDDLVRAGGRAALDRLVDAAEPMVERLYRGARGATPLRSPEAKAAVRARLDALAATVTDRELARDYGRALRDRLFQEGRADWQPRAPAKARGRRWSPPPPRAPSSAALTLSASDAAVPLVRAVLTGLCRRPECIRDVVEELQLLPTPEGALGELRGKLVEAGWRDSELDLTSLSPICADAGVRLTSGRDNGATGLAFGWIDPLVDQAAASVQIGHVLAVVIDWASAEAELQAAQATLATADDDHLEESYRNVSSCRERVAQLQNAVNEINWADSALTG